MLCLHMHAQMMLPGKSMAAEVTSKVFDVQVLHPPMSFEVVATVRTCAPERLRTHRTFQEVLRNVDY